MSESVFCALTVRIPAKLVEQPSDALAELRNLEWSTDPTAEVLEDGSELFRAGDCFSYGLSGLENVLDLASLAAVGCDWSVDEDGMPGEWEPTTVACIDGLRVALGHDSVGSPLVTLATDYVLAHSTEHVLAAMRHQLARSELVRRRLRPAPAIGVHPDHEPFVALVCDPPPSDAATLAARPEYARLLASNPLSDAATLVVAAEHLGRHAAYEAVTHPNTDAKVLEALLAHATTRSDSLLLACLEHPCLDQKGLARAVEIVAHLPVLHNAVRNAVGHRCATHELLAPLPAGVVASLRPELLAPRQATAEQRHLIEVIAEDFAGTLAELQSLAGHLEAQPAHG